MPTSENELDLVSFREYLRNLEANFLTKRNFRITCHPDQVPLFEEILGVKKENAS